MLNSTCLEIDEMEVLRNKNLELEEQINKMRRDFLLLKTKIFETDSLIEQLRKKKQESSQLQADKMKLLMHLKSQQVEFDKLRSDHSVLLLESLPLKKRNEELKRECEDLKLENESNKMIIKQLNASQSLNKDEILKLKAEIASLNKKPKCADKNTTLVSSSSSKKAKSAEPEDEISDSDGSMVDVECGTFSNSRISTPPQMSFSNDTQSKHCEEITSSGFKPSLSNIFSQGLTSQQTPNSCVDGKDKGTSNESYSLRNKKAKKPSQKNGKNKTSSTKKKKDDDDEEFAQMAKSLEMALCSDIQDSQASCGRTEKKVISSRSPLSSPQKLLRSKTSYVTNNKNCDSRKNQGNNSKNHHTKKLAKDLHVSSDDDEDDFEEVTDVSVTAARDKMAGGAKPEKATSPREKSYAGRKCESDQIHESSNKYFKNTVKAMNLSSDEEDDDDFQDVIDTTIMATTSATDENNLPLEMSNSNGDKNCAIKSSQAVESTFKHSKELAKDLHLSSDEDDDLEKLANDFLGVTPVENREKESSFKDTEATNIVEENDKNVSNKSESPIKTNDGSFVLEERTDADPDEVSMDSANKSEVYDELIKEMELSSDEDDEQTRSKIVTEKNVDKKDEHLHVQEDVQSLVKPNDSHPVIEGDQEVDDELSVNDVLTNTPIDVPTEIQIERPSSQSTMKHIPKKSEEYCTLSDSEGETECFINGDKLIDEPALTSYEEEALSKDASKGGGDGINVDVLENQFAVASNGDINTIAENEDAKEVEAISSCLSLHRISSGKDELSIDTASNNEAVVRSPSAGGGFKVTDTESVRILSDEIAEASDVNSNEEAIKTNDGSFISEEQMDADPDEGSTCLDSEDKSEVYAELMKEMEFSSDEDDNKNTTETAPSLAEIEDESFHFASEVQVNFKPCDSRPVIESEQEVGDRSFVIDAPIEIQIERPSLPLEEVPPNNSHEVVRNNIFGNKDTEEETDSDMPSFDASSRSEEKDGGFQREKRKNVTNHKVLNGANNKKLKKDEYAQKLMDDLFSSPTMDITSSVMSSSHNEKVTISNQTTTARLLAEKTLGKKFEENREKKTSFPKVGKMKHVYDDLQISSDSSDDEKDVKSEEVKVIKKNVEHKDTTIEEKKGHLEVILKEVLIKPQKEASSKLQQDPPSKPQKKTSGKLQRETATNLSKELQSKLQKEASIMLEKESASKLQIEDSGEPQKKTSNKIQKEAESKPITKRKRCQSPELVTNAKKLKVGSNEMSLGTDKGKANQTKPNGNGGKKEVQKAVKVVNARCKKDEKTFDDFQKLSPDDLFSLVELPRIHSPLKVPVVPIVPVVSVVPDKIESDKQRRCFVTSMIKAAMSSKVNPRNSWITKWKKKENSLVNPWVPPFILSVIDYIKDTAESHEGQEHQFIDWFLTESVCTIVKLKGNVKEQSMVSLCCVVVAMMRIQG